MKTLKFDNKDEMPALGLGTYKISETSMSAVINHALNMGYRHIDCAFYYKNEKGVGIALNEYFSKHNLKREEVWLTSKLWNNAHKREDVLPALKQSLQDLRVDYLDLYLIHWPVVFRPDVKGVPQNLSDYLTLEEVPIIETWEALVEAKAKGLVKHIGVSNFSLKKLKGLVMKANHKPEILQVESHPFLPQNELLKYCKKNNIHFTAYSPLGRGKAGTADNPSLFEDTTILKIARKHNCTPGQILIAWGLERRTSVIPKSANPKHIESNFKSQNIQLEQNDMDKLNMLSTHYRFGWGKSFLLPGSPYDNVFDE